MTTRQPAFWRVVRVRDGVREYLTFDLGWLLLGCYTKPFPVLSEANALAKSARGRVVPVYVTVRRVQRGHDFAWALRQMKAGKRVWRTSWPEGTFPWSFITLQNNGAACEAIIATDWVLAEASK